MRPLGQDKLYIPLCGTTRLNLTWIMRTTTTPVFKCVLYQGFCILVEYTEMNTLKDVCIQVQSLMDTKPLGDVVLHCEVITGVNNAK